MLRVLFNDIPPLFSVTVIQYLSKSHNHLQTLNPTIRISRHCQFLYHGYSSNVFCCCQYNFAILHASFAISLSRSLRLANFVHSLYLHSHSVFSFCEDVLKYLYSPLLHAVLSLSTTETLDPPPYSSTSAIFRFIISFNFPPIAPIMPQLYFCILYLRTLPF